MPKDRPAPKPGAYIAKLVDDAKAGDEAATRELAEIYWDWRGATDYWREIDGVLSEVGDQEENRNIREKLHRLYLMAFRSLGRAPIDSPSAHDYVLAPQRAAASEGGKNSGVTRLQNAEKRWKSEAEKMAKAIRWSNPDLSQEKVANKISDEWRGSGLPGHTTIKSFIRDLEKCGNLPAMVKNSSPKGLRIVR